MGSGTIVFHTNFPTRDECGSFYPFSFWGTVSRYEHYLELYEMMEYVNIDRGLNGGFYMVLRGHTPIVPETNIESLKFINKNRVTYLSGLELGI